jgi:hypothetical protein
MNPMFSKIKNSRYNIKPTVSFLLLFGGGAQRRLQILSKIGTETFRHP